jgi:hypothetical protein
MGLIIFALICSTIFLLVVIATAHKLGPGAVCGVSAVTTLLFMCLMAPAVALQALLTLLLAIACAMLGMRQRVISAGAIVAMIFSYTCIAMTRIEALRELHELRTEYPLESVSGRLGYEARGDTQRLIEHAPARLTPEVESRLRERESDGMSAHRVYLLQRLHSRTTDEFVIAQGFGPIRMASVHRQSVELPETPPVELPRSDEYSPGQPHLQPPLVLEEVTRTPSSSAMLGMHQRSVRNLLDPERTGYVQDRDHVAGFKAHQFSEIPSLWDEHRQQREWKVVRLDLISLLRHETPVAYVSKYLPRMDELRDAPTRSLDAFEMSALEKLRSQEDVVIDEGAGRIRMVGSLRASKDCLECHTAHRGQLLGALSYELAPTHGAPIPRDGGPLPPQASRVGAIRIVQAK